MNHDFINDFEQIDDNELDIYGETAQEHEAGINHLFDFITGYAARKLNFDASQESDKAVVYMVIDCLAKGVEKEVAVGHIMGHIMLMGFYISEDDIKKTLEQAEKLCIKEILAYKIAVEDVYESYAHPADVIMKVHKLLE